MKLDSPPLRRFARRLGVAAPLLTLAILIVSPAVVARPATTREDVDRQLAIKVAMEEVPWSIGPWVGSVVPVPTEATEILHPNALLSREYTLIGGRDEGSRVTLALIHCSDVRDMNGHWPLNCYPQSGWSLEELEQPVDIVANGGTRYPLALCRFALADKGGGVRTMTVLYAFILPDGRIETDIKALGDSAARTRDSAKGVAQFQFVFRSSVSTARCVDVAKALIDGIPVKLLRELGLSTEPSGRENTLAGEAVQRTVAPKEQR